MRQARLIKMLSGAATVSALLAASSLPAIAAPANEECKDGVCSLDAQQARADKGSKPAAQSDEACCEEEQPAKANKKGDDCDCPECKEEKAGKGKGHGPNCECPECGEKAGRMGGRGGWHGRMGMGMGMGMRGPWMRNMQRSAEIRYMPSALATAGATGNQFLVVGGGMQHGGDIFSLGFQHNLAVQLMPSGGQGNWVAPYCGIVPRLGVSLGKARIDLGVLGGLGGMVRTVSVPGSSANLLDARLQWVLEPRVELGMKGERMGVALVGTYTMTPNPQDMGGMGVGLKFTFKGRNN